MELHDLLGAVGVVLVVAMYFLLQAGRIRPQNPHYSLWNAVGSALIMVSLFNEFNLAALLIEVFWLAISLYGLARAVRVA